VHIEEYLYGRPMGFFGGIESVDIAKGVWFLDTGWIPTLFDCDVWGA